MSNKGLFNVAIGARPGRSAFDLSYSKQFTCGMGTLIPVACDECYPGDIWSLGGEFVIRANPLSSPVLHPIYAKVEAFFCPSRLLFDEEIYDEDTGSWEDFITGGEDGNDTSVLPLWPSAEPTRGDLWDMLGMPMDIPGGTPPSFGIPTGSMPLDFPRRMYRKTWNEYYRDENLQAELEMTPPVISAPWPGNDILRRNWPKDYFTSALLTQQKGTSPSLPVTLSGHSHAVFPASSFSNDMATYNGVVTQVSGDNNTMKMGTAGGLNYTAQNLMNIFNENEVDLGVGTLTTFDMSDLRLAAQIQKWLERNNRCGSRYIENIVAHFGPVGPTDERLQRVEMIGGFKSHIITSEVLQTSQTTTGAGGSPQGNLAGHGIGTAVSSIGKYRVKEHGYIMVLFSIIPKAVYTQGINRQWLRRTKYDFYFPEFANLSEQAITRAEIFANGTPADNTAIWGYTERYNELRFKPDMAVGLCRVETGGFAHWNLARIFDTAPALNSDFITCTPDTRIFAVENEDGFIVNYGNLFKAIRPIPAYGTPGLIDHN